MGAAQSTFKTTKDQIESGVHPDNIMNGGYPVIFSVTTKKELELLLREGSNIDLMYSGKTPLTRAAELGLLDQVRLLLMYGADVNPTISDIKFSDSCKLSYEMRNLLSCWGFPGGAYDQDEMADMAEGVCESSDVPHYPVEYNKFIREDDAEMMNTILDSAKRYNTVSHTLGPAYAMSLMHRDGFNISHIEKN